MTKHSLKKTDVIVPSDVTTQQFEGDAKIEITNDQLNTVRRLAARQITVEDALAEKEAELTALMKEYNTVRIQELPEAMRDVGLTSFTLETGETVEVKKVIKASIPAQHREAAFAWLREHGHDSIIKNDIVVSFGKGEDAKAEAFQDELVVKNHVYSVKKNVHSGTLSAFVKEQLEAGNDVPSTEFGVFEVNRSTVRRPK